jgi:DNA (cytosine-5)-methyltransferase 1
VIVDLFAGPGGWDLGALLLRLETLGIEWDEAACATRAAAGLQTLHADVAALDPMEFAPVRGLIASPPCQAFSMAGNGHGRRALAAYVRAIIRMATGMPLDVEALDAECEDPRGHLVLEPLRWALALCPEWIALEQVPPVLPLWEEMARALRELGYSTWCGLLSAERYGVPQTRQRAILIASSTREVGMPPPSHQRYIAPRKTEEATIGLFDAPEPERIVAPEDRGLLPWVSMAEALGWGMTARPYPVIASGRSTGGPDKEKVGGSGAREQLYAEREAGRWQVNTGRDWKEGGSREDAQTFDAGERPAPTVDGKGRWHVVDTGNTRGGTRECGRERSIDEPSAPLTTRADQMERRRVTGQRRSSGPGAECDPRSVDEPSYTLRAGSGGGSAGVGRCGGVEWTTDRPATTIAGDARVFPPGGHMANDGRDNSRMVPRSGGEASDGAQAIRVSIHEAAVLQSFPPDYPVQGTKTKQFEQVGNAIPPGLARAVLSVVVG